ncbi:hypothetical protein HMPREF9555_02189 [Selenomonas artemidis F0399]|uniref:Uncharacterized protein n=1 Tax=Selenomonas artemidis F0399 TaxID=749551 RepID=E7N595_9FIRM|nr:hypothetical protein HMPREF9555_02189 [Selenomonas artemidis F0399]
MSPLRVRLIKIHGHYSIFAGKSLRTGREEDKGRQSSYIIENKKSKNLFARFEVHLISCYTYEVSNMQGGVPYEKK